MLAALLLMVDPPGAAGAGAAVGAGAACTGTAVLVLMVPLVPAPPATDGRLLPLAAAICFPAGVRGPNVPVLVGKPEISSLRRAPGGRDGLAFDGGWGLGPTAPPAGGLRPDDGIIVVVREQPADTNITAANPPAAAK